MLIIRARLTMCLFSVMGQGCKISLLSTTTSAASLESPQIIYLNPRKHFNKLQIVIGVASSLHRHAQARINEIVLLFATILI